MFIKRTFLSKKKKKAFYACVLIRGHFWNGMLLHLQSTDAYFSLLFSFSKPSLFSCPSLFPSSLTLLPPHPLFPSSILLSHLSSVSHTFQSWKTFGDLNGTYILYIYILKCIMYIYIKNDQGGLYFPALNQRVCKFFSSLLLWTDCAFPRLRSFPPCGMDQLWSLIVILPDMFIRFSICVFVRFRFREAWNAAWALVPAFISNSEATSNLHVSDAWKSF